MTGYYHQCIPGYAHIAAPLTAMTHKNAVFEWGPRQQEAFLQLKQTLCSNSVVLHHPDPSKPYILHTDVSDFAVSAILTQEDDTGLDQPMQYVSRTLSSSQRKWATIVKEAYAIIYVLGRLRPYLQSARFVIYTDHKPLKSLFKCEMKNTMVQRWVMQIAEFRCEIRYRPGKNNVCADMLSRIRPKPEATLAGLSEVVRELEVAKEKRAEFPAEWAAGEQNDQDDGGDYAIIDGCLYSLLRLYSTTGDCPRLMILELELERLGQGAL